ncbi:MAG: MFS transporter [Bacillota bacterium]
MHTFVKKSGIHWGWWIVLVSFIANFMIFGARHAFGVFVLPISEELGWSRGQISSVFTVMMFVHGLGSIPFGRWTDKYSPQLTMSIAALIGFAGYALASAAQYLWQIFLTYGLFFGIGQAGIYVPSATTVRRWFDKKVGLAMGLTVAAIGAGGFFLAPFTKVLIEQAGWRYAFLITGLLGLITVVPTSFLVMRSDPAAAGLQPYGYNGEAKNEKENGITHYRDVFRQPCYWLISLSFGLAVTGVYTVSTHIVALARHIGFSDATGTMALGLIAVSSFLGRIVMGFYSDYIGCSRALRIALSTEVLAGVILFFVNTPLELMIFSVIIGFGYGSFVPLFPALIGEMFGNKDLSFIFGIANSFTGVGAGLGTLAAGVIFDVFHSYFYALVMILACFAASLILAFTVKGEY